MYIYTKKDDLMNFKSRKKYGNFPNPFDFLIDLSSKVVLAKNSIEFSLRHIVVVSQGTWKKKKPQLQWTY